jgi:hypothetical protein
MDKLSRITERTRVRRNESLIEIQWPVQKLQTTNYRL